MNELERLAKFICEIKYDDIPSSVIEAGKLCVLDSFAAAAGASGDELAVNIAGEYKSYYTDVHDVDIWGMGMKAPMIQGAFINSLMGHRLELDDVHTKSKTHIGTVVVPVALCMAQYSGASGKEFLEAVICGYEVMSRIGMAFGVSSHRNKGWHVTSTAGTFGACAAASKLLKLDEEKTAHALGMAGTQSFGLRLVQDSNIVLAGKNVPYNNLKELVEYAKANPNKTPTLGMMSINGIDGAAATQLFDVAGIKVNFIPYSSGAEANAAVMGGHTDMVLTSPFDGKAYVDSGDMKPIVLLAEQRSSALPNVECTGELGYDAYIGPWRGIVAKKGTPQGAIDALEKAAIAVNEKQEWIDWKATVGLNDRPGFAKQNDFKKIWFDYYETMKELRGK